MMMRTLMYVAASGDFRFTSYIARGLPRYDYLHKVELEVQSCSGANKHIKLLAGARVVQ